MTDERLREFYELCQAYRTTPVSDIVAVRESYDALVEFVRKAQGMGDAYCTNCGQKLVNTDEAEGSHGR